MVYAEVERMRGMAVNNQVYLPPGPVSNKSSICHDELYMPSAHRDGEYVVKTIFLSYFRNKLDKDNILIEWEGYELEAFWSFATLTDMTNCGDAYMKAMQNNHLFSLRKYLFSRLKFLAGSTQKLPSLVKTIYLFESFLLFFCK